MAIMRASRASAGARKRRGGAPRSDGRLPGPHARSPLTSDLGQGGLGAVLRGATPRPGNPGGLGTDRRHPPDGGHAGCGANGVAAGQDPDQPTLRGRRRPRRSGARAHLMVRRPVRRRSRNRVVPEGHARRSQVQRLLLGLLLLLVLSAALVPSLHAISILSPALHRLIRGLDSLRQSGGVVPAFEHEGRGRAGAQEESGNRPEALLGQLHLRQGVAAVCVVPG